MATLDSVADIVQTVESETYARFETLAGQRISRRDPDDWPILAAALALSCPIWTEDTGFFGCDVDDGPGGVVLGRRILRKQYRTMSPGRARKGRAYCARASWQNVQSILALFFRWQSMHAPIEISTSLVITSRSATGP